MPIAARQLAERASSNDSSVMVPGVTTRTIRYYEELGLLGPKYGCAEGECGACTVLVDDVSLDSCLMFAVEADGFTVACADGRIKVLRVKPADGPEVRMNAAVWRYHPTRKTFEIFSEGTSNPWGMDWRNTDGQFILACCVIP